MHTTIHTLLGAGGNIGIIFCHIICLESCLDFLIFLKVLSFLIGILQWRLSTHFAHCCSNVCVYVLLVCFLILGECCHFLTWLKMSEQSQSVTSQTWETMLPCKVWGTFSICRQVMVRWQLLFVRISCGDQNGGYAKSTKPCIECECKGDGCYHEKGRKRAIVN